MDVVALTGRMTDWLAAAWAALTGRPARNQQDVRLDGAGNVRRLEDGEDTAG